MFLSFAGLAGLAPYGCGGSNTAAQPTGSPSAYNTFNPNAPATGASGYPAAGQPAGYPAATAPAGYPAATAPQATAAPQPTAAPTAGAQDAIVGALIAPVGAKYAPGMSAAGAPFSANMTAGTHQSMMVTMQAGSCYTVVGVSPPGVGVTSLNLSMLAPPFYTTSAGASTVNTNESVIGAGKTMTCPILPIPIQYKIDIFAKTGNGPVAVQVFSKPK